MKILPLNLLNNKYKINRSKIKELDKIEVPADFLKKSYSFIMKSVGINEDIAPELVIKNLQSDSNISYRPELNSLIVNSKCLNLSRPRLYSLIRHQSKHVEQVYNAFRTEGFNERAINIMAEKSEKAALVDFFNMVNSSSVEDLTKLFNDKKISLEVYKTLIAAKQAIGKGKSYYQSFEAKLFNAEIPFVKKSLKKLQESIIKRTSTIKENSLKAKIAKNEFISILDKENCEFFPLSEISAYAVTFSSYMKYLISKWF